MSFSSPELEIRRDAEEIFSKFIAAEYAYFTPKGEPLCWPVTPYWYPDRQILAVATGLAYPNKADYAKKNPKVALFFSDATSSGLSQARHLLVHGDATVLDDDIQQNTDRYVHELRRKFAAARFALNPLTVKMLDFYLPRLWVEITPRQLKYAGDATSTFHVSRKQNIDAFTTHRSLNEEERKALRRVIAANDSAVLTTKGPQGYPDMKRTKVRFDGGNSIELDHAATGAACLTIHRHTLGGVRFQAYLVRGVAAGTRFIPSRLAGFFGNGTVFPLSVVPNVARLRRNLKLELAKRGKPMPELRVPDWLARDTRSLP